MKVKWYRLILFFFYNPSCFVLWSELIPVQFYVILIFFIRSELVRVDPSWSNPDWRSELIRSDFCTCLAKIFVCPMPKISHVMIKFQASHLGRFHDLWNNGRRRAAVDALWHNSVDLLCGTRASQLAGKFTLWLHNSVDLLCGTTAA